METQIRENETRLRLAMLSSNVAELDRLIDDRLLFVGPDTGLYGKADDLELHRSGTSRFEQINVIETRLELHGAVATVMVVADLAGTFKGEAFANRCRYLRIWALKDGAWKVVAGSVCNLDG